MEFGRPVPGATEQEKHMCALKLLRSRNRPGHQPWWRTVARLRHPGWSWTVGRDWLIPGAVAVATLFLGAGLGGVPALVAGTWHDPQTRIAAWAAAALGIVGLLAVLATWLIWRGRNRILSSNGTAYIIQETAHGWSADDSRAFIISAKRQFARMITVPGPGTPESPWGWSLDEDAQDWDSKVTELVHAFQALRSDDDPVTPKGIFMWAWAPVAIAFGARVTAADRGLTLDVWQRPSRGRAGDVENIEWSQRPHQFGRGQRPQAITKVLPGSAVGEYRWSTHLSTTSPAAASTAPRDAVGSDDVPVILLVRLGKQSWGPLPEAPAEPNPATTLTMELEDQARLTPSGTFDTDIYELRVLPPDGDRLFPWAAYPALVSKAATWIRKRASDMERHPVLVGAIMPPEIALGLGIDAARPTEQVWPGRLWPIILRPSSGTFVLPRLNLGTVAYFSSDRFEAKN
jgi:hypothetical protein